MGATSAVATGVWDFFPHVIFYRTGFPFELLERLRFARTTTALRALDRAMHEAEACRDTVLHRVIPAAVRTTTDSRARRALSVTRRKIGRWREVPAVWGEALNAAGLAEAVQIDRWNAVLAALAARQAEAERTFAEELPERRAALRDIASDRRFQEAVFTSNPNLYPGPFRRYLERFRLGERPLEVRRFERLLTSYVQRCTAKTDVASLFGPINFAQLDPCEPCPVVLEHPPDRMLARREAFISFWAVEAIAARMSTDPHLKPYLRPRFSPMCELRDGPRVFIHLLDEEQPVSPFQAAALAHADGHTPVAAIAARLGQPVTEVLTALEPLAAQGIVSLEVQVPSTVFHPFNVLLDFVRALPESCPTRGAWLVALEGIDAARVAFRDGDLDERVERFADLERRFTALAGVPARRRQGETYADRTIVYEDCQGTVQRFVFGAPFITHLRERLGPALEICTAYGWLCRTHYQWMSGLAYRALCRDGVSVSFSRFVNQLQAMGRAGRFPAKSEAMVRFERAWTDLVQGRARAEGGRVARLSREDVERLVALAPPPKRNVHAAPDLLISARDEDSLRRGDYRLIVGEVGENVYVWGSQFFFYDRRIEAEQAVDELFRSLPDYHPFAMILARRPHKGLLHESFAGTIVDAFAYTTRPLGRTVPFRDLRVEERDGELVLTTTDGRRFTFFHHHDDLVHLWTFAPPRIMVPPLDLDGHLPRIEVEGVVLQRQQWRLRAADLDAEAGNDFERFRRVWRAKERLGLPDQVFVHVPSEIKPFAIDFTSFFSVELLAHIVHGQEQVRVVEMLPTPDELWFQEQGGRFCTELRFLAYRR